MRLTLAILYTPSTGKPLRIASVTDPELLARAAAAAIDEAQSRADQLAEFDRELSQVERVEADRLRQIFCGMLAPCNPGAATVM